MKKKAVTGITLTLLFIGVLTLAFNIQTVKAEPKTWTVDDDGPADFHTIQEAINVASPGDTIFVYNGTYYEHVVVNKPTSLIGENRGTTVIDGNGTGNVIDITANLVSVTGFTIRNGTNGIFINWDYNIISGNIVTDNQNGIHLFATCPCNPASENTITNNIIKNNNIGIHLEICLDNVIYHNNFINNTVQAYVTAGYVNIWDDGYPSGGNYWSNYTGFDSNHDGIGDTPHIIDANNTDRYPLMEPWTPTQPTPVGGIYITVNKLELLAPYIGLTILLAVAVTTVGYVKRRKKQ